ncbi:Disease resistance protein [Melia azedarach]|uniref:Disease resistance protein n=1 Tax=Melia azedarach TaxID=155640 RepID=A0ACC1Y561_MELAZ|nr:Disease resistance protein [Melia azedarach]
MGNNISIGLTPNSSLSSFFTLVAEEAKYIRHLEENLEALKTEFDRLIRTKEDLLNDVKIAEQQPMMRRTNQVKGWIGRVDEMETEVNNLLKDGSREVDKLCLGGLCSLDLISGYFIGKKVPKLTEEVPVIVGQQSTLEKLWGCIVEKQVRIIGVYGLGGVGKTTLLKQINNNFCTEKHNFDIVIWVVVSKEAKLEQIQDEIGKRIGRSADSWKSKSVRDKASDICNILRQKKFVLLLDDIWQRIELSELGIPLQSLNISSKILFTTRCYDVCGEMDADKIFEVKCLTENQAWNLFQEKVGTSTLEGQAGILEQATMVARECDDLPLALITIGRTMASKKTLQEWKNALRYLRTSSYQV